MTKSVFEMKLTQKALNFRFGVNNDLLVDHILEDRGTDKALPKMKNVCAHMSEDLVNRLENTLGLLEMSKREFITMAVIEALEKAETVMDECGVYEALEEMAAVSKRGSEAA